MIPTYEPGPFLEPALASVLAQDPGPGEMQIEVIDDASPRTDTAALVRRTAGDRVAVRRQPVNGGLARNWNECIRRASGQVIHIMHQDDIVRPGFYAALRPAFEGPAPAGAAFCRFTFLDEAGRPSAPSFLERGTAGVLDDWLRKMAISQRIVCSSVVVRRDVYEALGGFRSDLVYALDWEMWARIASRYAFWYEPAVLCGFRVHAGSESSRLQRSAATVRDHLRCLDILQSYLPRHLRRSCLQQGQRHCATDGLNTAYQLARRGHFLPAARAFHQSFVVDPVQAVLRVLHWATKAPRRYLTRALRSAAPEALPPGA
jgi:glycosyltransferase involved in cell wall biosynthesis